MNDIEAMLRATIQTKVIEAFNSAPDVIEKLVEAALSKEVNEYGSKPDGYRDKKMPYMEWLVGEEIRRAVTAEVHKYVESNQEAIATKVREAIASSELGKPLGEAIAQMLSTDYCWRVNLNIEQNK